jgi:hypothetical protein
MKRLAVILSLVLLFSLSPITGARVVLAGPLENLLDNPGAESGDMSGWTLLANGGSGWKIDATGRKEGTNSFATSYSWCKRFQEIDLNDKGFSLEQMDSAPSIDVGEWFAGYGAVWMYDNAHEDYAYLKVQLRDARHNVLAEYKTDIFQCLDHNGKWFGPWMQKGYTFKDYGPGVRYIYFEDGGKDREFWDGDYGTRLDAAYVNIYRIVPVFSEPAKWIFVFILGGLIIFLTLSKKILSGRNNR